MGARARSLRTLLLGGVEVMPKFVSENLHRAMMPARGIGHRDIRQAIESQYASAAPTWPMTFPVTVQSPKGRMYEWSAFADRTGDDVAITLTPVDGMVPASEMNEFNTLHAVALEMAMEHVKAALGDVTLSSGKAWMK